MNRIFSHIDMKPISNLVLKRTLCRSFQHADLMLSNSIRTPVITSVTHYSSIQQKIKKFKKETEYSGKTLIKDTVVYTNDSTMKMILISMVGTFVLLVFLNSAEVVNRFAKKSIAKVKKGDFTPSKWDFFSIQTDGGRYGFVILLLFFGFTVFGLSMIYPSRVVKEITLLKGGQEILLSTYRPFGFSKTLKVPLSEFSCRWSLAESRKYDYMPFKLKGKPFQFIVSQSGEFHHRDLFEKEIALSRGF